MEGKELYSNEDEELNPQSGYENEDADDFGLPEIEDSDDDQSDLGDPYSSSTSDYASYADTSYDDKSDDDYTYSDDTEEETPASDDDYRTTLYDEEETSSSNPTGWIIFAILVVIALGVGGYFAWDKYFKDKPAPTPPPVVADTTAVDNEAPPEIIEEEPVSTKTAGVYDISEPTGNYHVIVASSIDVDLVRDYANKLAKEGMVCNILAPRGNKKFHRLSVADFASLNDATIEMERLKSTLGDDVWVIRY